jgi:hypothetical protein
MFLSPLYIEGRPTLGPTPKDITQSCGRREGSNLVYGVKNGGYACHSVSKKRVGWTDQRLTRMLGLLRTLARIRETLSDVGS